MGQGKSLCSDGAYWPKLIGQKTTMKANSSHACDCRRSLGRCAEMESNWRRNFRGLTKVLAPALAPSTRHRMLVLLCRQCWAQINAAFLVKASAAADPCVWLAEMPPLQDS
jgi:hypothetical protein